MQEVLPKAFQLSRACRDPEAEEISKETLLSQQSQNGCQNPPENDEAVLGN